LHIGVSDFYTAIPFLIKPKTEEDIFSAINASTLLPGLTSERAYIKDTRYMDGGFSSPHILEEALEKIEFTHVLILTSQNKDDYKVGLLETILNETVFRGSLTKLGLLAARTRKKSRLEALQKLKERTGIKYLLVWGDGSINGTEQNSKKIKSVVNRYKKSWLEVMSKDISL
jgi:predicted patatin/cPLA2 family phospholipase